ncbi:MAG: hypothetical protein KDD50_08820 [Bdellovibrionales bacterium]|nr:hypothetical protein [Bdellovibrionales bacterium]
MSFNLLSLNIISSLIFTLCSISARATITLNTSVSGASAYDYNTVSGIPIVYGGLGGTCSSTDGTNACDSCANAPTAGTACNQNRIYDSLQLTITLKSDKASSGSVIITTEDGKTPLTMVTSETVGSTNTYGSVTVLWTYVCDTINTDAVDCDSTAAGTLLSGNLLVGIDGNSDGDLNSDVDDSAKIAFRVYSPETSNSTNGANCTSITGACALSVYPGDEKVYINSFTAPTGFASVKSDIKVKYVRLMFSAVNFDSLSVVENYQDFEIIDDATNISGYLDGLTNDTPYVFKYASIDDAGNIYNFLDAASFSSASGCIASSATPSISDTTCAYIATPGKVFGLLSEDLNCFIATAAYGSSWAPPLKTLRAFRNTYLLTHDWGKAFVLSYYKYGSQAAYWIKNSPGLKVISQILLWPLWAFAWMSLQIGLWTSLILWGLVVGSFFYIFKRRFLCAR